MTPKEKAEKIHDNIYRILTKGKAHHNIYLGVEYIKDKWIEAKQCALIAVNEIISIVEKYEDALSASQQSDQLEYWKQIKQEMGML